DVVDEVFVGGGDAPFFADDGGALDDELVADGDGHAAGAVNVGDLSEADFGSAEVAEDGNGMGEPGGGFADVAKHLQVAVEITVREIQTADIAAGFEEAIQGFDVAAGGSHRGEDFCSDHVSFTSTVTNWLGSFGGPMI